MSSGQKAYYEDQEEELFTKRCELLSKIESEKFVVLFEEFIEEISWLRNRDLRLTKAEHASIEKLYELSRTFF